MSAMISGVMTGVESIGGDVSSATEWMSARKADWCSVDGEGLISVLGDTDSTFDSWIVRSAPIYSHLVCFAKEFTSLATLI